MDQKQRIVVGVNEFVKKDEKIEIPILELGEESEINQIKAIEELRKKRDNQTVNDALAEIRDACLNGRNIMEPIIHAAKVYATLGEIVQEMKDVFGEWQETTVI